MIFEPIEQPTLSPDTTNKDPVNYEPDVPITNHANPIRRCTVHLEILTEADIVKHIHVHKELKPEPVPPTKLDEAVETVGNVETVHITRSRTKKSHQGQTDSPEQQVITLPMYTRMMEVTVKVVPWLKENVN